MTYLAQLFNKHGSISQYLAKHDAPLLNIVFQGGRSAEHTGLKGFQLELFRPDFIWDTLRYTLAYDDFIAQLTVTLIDSVTCVPESNVDFVHFVWDIGDQSSCTRYSITLIPLTTILTPVRGRNTSLFTVVGAMVRVIRTVARCADPTIWRAFVTSPTTASSTADPVNAQSADANLFSRSLRL